MKPLISVITISYNAEGEIGKTIESVLAQTLTDYEYIFVDGASKDSTLSVIKSYRERFDADGVRYRVISEPDKGIYDAMNKGIHYATGEWLIMMNAGDCFADKDVLKDFFARREYDADVVYGDTIQKEIYRNDVYCRMVEALPVETIGNGMPFCHQSVFVHHTMMEEYGFDTSYKISADYDLFLKAYRDGKKFKHIQRVVAVYDCSGVTFSNSSAAKAEAVALREKYHISPNDSWRKQLKRKLKESTRENVKKIFPHVFFSSKRGWYRCNLEP